MLAPTRRSLLFLVLALAPALVLAPGPAGADDAGAPDDTKRFSGSLTLLIENDIFIDSSDDNYTAGGGFAWVSDDVATYGRKHFAARMSRAFSFLPIIDAPRYKRFVSLSTGFEMYTPEDISSSVPPADQQPYAGIVFAAASVYGRGPRSMHGFSGRIGCVGPCSGAETVQTEMHELIGSPVPQGWDYQLKNELLVNASYQYHRRLVLPRTDKRMQFDLTAQTGGALGNYYTGANGGFVARVGRRLPDSYFTGSLRAGTANRFVGHPQPGRKWQLFGFASLQAFGVARFLPTDGNTFRDGPSVERDDLIGVLAAGIVVGRDRFVFSWTFNSLGGFDDISKTRAQDFSTFTLTYYIPRRRK